VDRIFTVNHKKGENMMDEKLKKLRKLNMILQYKKMGKWKDYIYGERVYIILSLVSKTILAWLVFFGAMQP